jgi:hypothetical protein
MYINTHDKERGRGRGMCQYIVIDEKEEEKKFI